MLLAQIRYRKMRDVAWRDRAVATLGAGQLNGLIAGQALGFDHATTIGDRVAGILSQP